MVNLYHQFIENGINLYHPFMVSLGMILLLHEMSQVEWTYPTYTTFEIPPLPPVYVISCNSSLLPEPPLGSCWHCTKPGEGQECRAVSGWKNWPYTGIFFRFLLGVGWVFFSKKVVCSKFTDLSWFITIYFHENDHQSQIVNT
jgi:hypothetical protein